MNPANAFPCRKARQRNDCLLAFLYHHYGKHGLVNFRTGRTLSLEIDIDHSQNLSIRSHTSMDSDPAVKRKAPGKPRRHPFGLFFCYGYGYLREIPGNPLFRRELRLEQASLP